MNEKSYTEVVSCSVSTKNKLINECVKEFLSHHPEFKSMKITQGFILEKVVEYYLKY